MMKRSVWHPQRSITNDGSEEGGRGSFHASGSEFQATDSNQLKTANKKAKIPRRRTPTVDVSALVSRASSTKQNSTSASGKTASSIKARDTYDTIESQDGLTILECSSVVYRRDPQANINSNADINELCGWRDREIDHYKAATDRSATSSNFDHSRLQTPADGLRSSLQSRAGKYSHQASSYGKRKEFYVFQHFREPRHYIEHYRITQSYTTLNVPGLKRKMSCECGNGLLGKSEKLPPEPKVVEQDPDSCMQLEVKSYYQDADPYLQELVSRLGVRGLIQTREQQLLRSSKPTPPSITRKTKPREDLVVSSNGKTSEEDCVNEQIPAGQASNQDSSESKMSRPATRSAGQGAANMELPKISRQGGHTTGPVVVPPQRTKPQSSNSVISVNKYLQVVTSQKQQSLPEGNENSHDEKRAEEEAAASEDCLPRVQSSGVSYLFDTPPAEKNVSASHEFGSGDTVEQPTRDKSMQGKRHLNGIQIRDVDDEFHTPNTAAMKLAVQEQLMMLDNMQKERLISNKAHALGLTSRDWAKSEKAKRMLKGSDGTKLERNRNEITQHRSNEKERTEYRCMAKSRPTTRMAATAAMTNQTRASSRMDQSTDNSRTRGSYYTEGKSTGGLEKYRELEREMKRSSGDYIHHQKPSGESRRRREEDERKLEKLRSIYDSSSRQKNKSTPNQPQSRGPSRLHSRCSNRRMMSRPVTRLASWEQKTTKSMKVSPSRPVTQAGQRRSKVGQGEAEGGQSSPTRASVKDMMDLERRLDESCCWNEIPVKTQFHSKPNYSASGQNSTTGNGTETLDFDLNVNNIVLRAKHKGQGGVAMVTVRLRKQRNQHNRHTLAQHHTIHPLN